MRSLRETLDYFKKVYSELRQLANVVMSAIGMLIGVALFAGITLVVVSLVPIDDQFIVANVAAVTIVAWFAIVFTDGDTHWHHLQVVAIICALIVGYFSAKATPETLARISDTSYFEVVAQVIPVLMLARVIDLGIRVRRLSALDVNRVVEVVSIAILAWGELSALYAISDGFANSVDLGTVNAALVYGFFLVVFAGFRDILDSGQESGSSNTAEADADDADAYEPHGYL